MAWASCFTPDFRVLSAVGAAAGTSATNDRRVVESVGAGVPTIVADSFDLGRYALRADSTAAISNIGLTIGAATARYVGAMCRFKLVSGTPTSALIMTIAATTGGDGVKVRVNATGFLGYSFNNGSAYTDTVYNVGNNPHWLEVFVDWNTGTTHTLKIRLDGSEIVNATGGAVAVTSAAASTVVFGAQAITSYVMDYADLATYNDPAQYGLLQKWKVYGLEPISDATHSMTANDFQDAASGNLTNATSTSWDFVNDAPGAAPTVTDFVKQVVLRTTSYMEWNIRPLPTGTLAPVLVRLAAAMHPVAGNAANSVGFQLNSGGNLSGEAAIDTSVATDTLEYRAHTYTTEPGGAAWTVAKAQALKAQFGRSGDVTPPPALDSIMAMVLADSVIVPPAWAPQVV